MERSYVLTFLCVIYGSSPEVSSQRNDVNIVINSPVYAKIGSNLTLLCQYTWASGVEIQAIEWYKDVFRFFKQTWFESGSRQRMWWYDEYTTEASSESRKMAFLGSTENGPNGNASVVIMNVVNADKGWYKCGINLVAATAFHTLSDEVEVKINIEPAVPTVTFEPDKTHLTDGDTIVMTCTGNVGSPPGILSWKRKNGVIWDIQGQPQEQFQIIENKTDGSKVGRIVFNYTFVANNNDTGAVFRCDVSRAFISQEIISSATRAFNIKDTVKPTGNEEGGVSGGRNDIPSKIVFCAAFVLMVRMFPTG